MGSLLGVAASNGLAQILDTIVFGDSASETAHGFNGPRNAVETGALGQSTRRMFVDPASPSYNAEGGYLQFTAKVDPVADNFVTMKLWGSDCNRTASGKLLLFAVENGTQMIVGYPDQQVGEYSPLAWGYVDTPPFPGRFYYTTIPLPLSLTQGRTSVTLRIMAQQMDAKGSLPVYRAYVHTGSYFEPVAGDPQAPAPAPAPIKPPQPVSLQEALDEAKRVSNQNVTSWLANGGGDPDQLILAYQTPWSTGHQNAQCLTNAADVWTPSIDNAARRYFQDNNTASGAWGGAFGQQGDQIRKVTAAGFGSRLDDVVDLGDPAGPAKRRVLWSKMLMASRDYGRTTRLGPTSAQSVLGDNEIYKANKGLQTLGSADAFPESVAIRYLLEASGLLPWLGADRLDGSHDSFMGTNYYELTPDGMTKENGYVSAYGEVYDAIAYYYAMSGDTRIRDRINQIFKTRSYFKYPMVDSQGYRCFQLVGPLDWRHQQEMPVNVNYGESGTRLSVAPNTLDPYAMAVAKQQIADNQGGVWGTDMGSAVTLEKILNAPDTGARLPMTEGQPDFAWVDVDNGVAVIKRGEERTWIEPYWQARKGTHSTGRVLQITPTSGRIAHVRIDTQVRWNQVWSVKPDGWSDGGTVSEQLYGPVHQAYYNDKFLNGSNPDLPNTTREEFIGRAQFYSCRFGRYLVGINMDKTQSFDLKTPPGFTSALDMITKTTKSGTITLPPVSAVVLDLGTNSELNPLPRSARYITANGVQGGNSIAWDTIGGATTYTVKRSTTSGGPYTTIASGIGGIYPKKWGNWPFGTYVDSTAANGTTYFYKVAGVNANGEGYPSPESVGATPSTVASVNPLPAPWANVNWSAGGSASYASGTGTFSLTGGGGDVWWGADGGHFVYQPISGDGAIVARITSQGNAYKSGLIIRQTLGADSMNVALVYQNGNVGAQRRDSNGAGSEGVPGSAGGLTLPVWLKLEHRGKETFCSYAPDVSGAPGAWTNFSTWRNDLSGTAYIGMFSSSGNPTTFDKVTGPLYGNRLPTAPGTLSATAGNARVTLAWSAADQAASYTVRRATTAGGPYNTVVASNLTGLNYTDAGLTNGTPYYYVLTATNATGTGPNSSQVSATPVATAPTPTNLTVSASGTQAVLNWTASSGATGYTVQRSIDGVNWTTLATGITGTTYTNTGLAAGQNYYYSVQATNGNGASASTASVIGTTQPTIPRLRSVDSVGTQAKVRWDTAGAATSYNVWRSGTVGGTYTKVGANIATSLYTDSGLTAGSDYFYKISGFNAAGESAQSSAIKLGWGTGLLGNYYNSTNFSGPSQLTRLDPSIVFNWGQNPPAPGMNYDFSVRWTGQLEAPTTETYTFTGYADDNISATINGVQVVNNGTINLVAGQKYDFTVDFRDNEGAGYFNLLWSTPTMQEQNLPTSRIYPAAPSGTNRASGGTATASSAGGEGPANAFDGNAGSKWSTNGNGVSAWLQYQFASGVTWAISQYQITSANDVSERDPKDWQLQGSNDGTSWTTLDSRSGQTFANPYQTNTYAFVNTTAYAYYRLNITANSGGANYGIQLSELALLTPVPLPAAPAAPTLVAASKHVTVTWPAISGATAYMVRRAIYDGGPYTPIARVVSGTSFIDNGVVNGNTYYYVVGTVSAVGEGGNSPQSSVSLPASAAPAAATSSDMSGAPNEQPAQAFDGNSNTKWCISGAAAWLQIQSSNSQIVTGYVITSAGDVPQRDPKDWQFQGSNDGTTWTTLGTETAESFAGRLQSNVYPAANATAYTRYRLNITANAGGTGYGLQLAELTFQYSLPSPWSTSDIGTTGAVGGAAALNGVYPMLASGADIWGTADSFRYVYQTATGDCSITARVTSQQNTNGSAIVGVMIRETLNANSVQVTSAITPSGYSDMIVRNATGGNSTWAGSGGYTAPYWVRVVRTGNSFTASLSPDGATWTPIGTQTVSMGASVYIGLAGCSHASGTLMRTGFDSVTAVP